MTVVFCGTNGIFATPADPCETVFTGRTGIAITADASISLLILRTKSCSRVTTSSKEAVTFTITLDFTGWDANTGLAGFAIGAEVCVITCGVIRFNRIGAQAGGRVADADLMAVI